MAVALATPEGEAARAAARVARRTVLAVARADAATADHKTGRDVQTAHATVARALDCCPKTVQRARQLIEHLGFARTVEMGRYLTSAERAEARKRHGGHQLRMASDRVLCLPRTAYQQENVHLPLKGQLCGSVTSVGRSPKRAGARSGGAPRRSATTKDRPSLAMQRLAARLAARLPWLRPGHQWTLCRTLAAVGIDPAEWTAAELLDLLDRRNAAQGRSPLAPAAQHDPLALLAHQLRDALAQVSESPGRRRARAAAERAQAAAQARAEREALAAQLEAERTNPEAQARIAAAKAEIRSHLAAVRDRARYQPHQVTA
ncbi:replication protein [Luteococcus sp. H138]|uniref:replication protein n=1 Tax=unclassified Luteococcus TaxID=2639923 RepID=UPI00313C1C28